jgi:uncharacterized protein (DUF885 family)
MKKLILLAALATAACSSNHDTKQSSASNDLAFDNYKQQFILRLWKLQPGWASSVGYHVYDSVLVVPGNKQMASELQFIKAESDSLASYELGSLSDFNKMDFYLIQDYLKASRWSLDTLKAYEWDPSNYNVCGSFSEMLANNYDSLDNRLRNMAIRLKAVPAYYEAAKTIIKTPTPEHTDLAILQNEGGVSVFETDITEALKNSHLTADEKKNMTASCAAAAAAVHGYATWLKQLQPKPTKSFRLGKTLYDQKFKYDIASGFTADEIYAKARARKTELHLKMFSISKELWGNYFKEELPSDSLTAIKKMIDVLSLKHVKPDSFQISIEQQIPELVRFIREKNLIYLDSTKPLVVRKEPAYMAGMAGASISSPGPYDRNGNTYYNVGSMSGWSKERAESYLREYNHYVLQILNIHEAIPGHYTQLIYSNQSAGTSNKDNQLPGIIKTIFGNGAMIEGWAVYSELMMLENGYGAEAGQKTASPEMWLMYYKWNLRSTCNTILDHDIQVNNLSKEEGIRLLTREAFQQQAEAEGKWRRATLSQVQLCCYFTGFSEIVALREEIKTRMGKDFDLKSFHEKFLSYGSAPVKYIREAMLRDLTPKTN